MDGTITFDGAAELAKFLKEFTGSTAIFKVRQEGEKFVLEFTGGF